MLTGPIILIEDDDDDCQFFLEAIALTFIKNQIKCFQSVPTAMEYLRNTTDIPFFIVSDINLKGLSGFDLKKRINESEAISCKQTPFIFMSTSGDNETVRQAFKLCAQGFFQKADDITTYNLQIQQIVSYWSSAHIPRL